MNLNEVREILCKKDLIQTVYFSRKTKTQYISYSPEVDPRILNDLLNYIYSYLETFTDLEQIEFNPTGCRDGTVEICSSDYLGNFEEVINSFNAGNIEKIEKEVDNLSFYCIDIEDEVGNNVKLFRRVTKFKRLYSKGVLAAFQGNRLNKVDDKMLGLDGGGCNFKPYLFGANLSIGRAIFK